MRPISFSKQARRKEMINRRRFIVITSTVIATGIPSQAAKWNGVALGADASIQLHGNPEHAKRALNAAVDTLRRLEKQFSLFDQSSTLSTLNKIGHTPISPEFSALCSAVDHVFTQTDGLFDPTIQPLWVALKNNPFAPATDIMKSIGWDKVMHSSQSIKFTRNQMSISLNGIAQGFVTDRVRMVLAAHGFGDSVVNIGEYAVGDRNAQIGIANTQGQILKIAQVRNGAIATTSPSALMLTADGGHILHPQKGPIPSIWDTISVRAQTACFADAYSTALALCTDTRLAQKLVTKGEATYIFLKANTGQVFEI
jgi:thiamine biosynthesis lipoprotein